MSQLRSSNRRKAKTRVPTPGIATRTARNAAASFAKHFSPLKQAPKHHDLAGLHIGWSKNIEIEDVDMVRIANEIISLTN